MSRGKRELSGVLLSVGSVPQACMQPGSGLRSNCVPTVFPSPRALPDRHLCRAGSHSTAGPLGKTSEKWTLLNTHASHFALCLLRGCWAVLSKRQRESGHMALPRPGSAQSSLFVWAPGQSRLLPALAPENGWGWTAAVAAVFLFPSLDVFGPGEF